MPSNDDLIVEINELAVELGTEVKTEGLKNVELVATLRSLKTAQNGMPLIEEVRLLAEKLGSPISTDGLDVDQLKQLIKDLTTAVEVKKRNDADAKEKAEETAKAEAAKERPPYFVKEGRAITTNRGIISDGEEIKPEDIYGGKETLEGFVKSGHIGRG